VNNKENVVEYVAVDDLVVVLAIDRMSLTEIITPSLYQNVEYNRKTGVDTGSKKKVMTEGGPLLVPKNNCNAVQVVASDAATILLSEEAKKLSKLNTNTEVSVSSSSSTKSSTKPSATTMPSVNLSLRPRSTSFTTIFQTIYDGIRDQNLNTILNRDIQQEEDLDLYDDEINMKSLPPSPMKKSSNLRQVQLSNFNRKCFVFTFSPFSLLQFFS
jgi:hypothetical protein